MEWALALPHDALILDLAAGRGRHAVPLAAAGRRVVALDVVERAVAGARRAAPRVMPVVGDAAALPIREGAVDAVLCVSYLDRDSFPHLVRLLRPGGRLIVETYTTMQRLLPRGPRDPSHLLEPGELPRLVAPLEPLAYREGLARDAAGERYVASVVAVKLSGLSPSLERRARSP
jgi:SAM-dependent methyltransferase